MIKKTRTVHRLYRDWQKLPKDIRNFPYFERKCIIGKWHYHYEKDGKKISLVRFNHGLDFTLGYHYEACGTLDFERFHTLSQAESAIYEKLGESYDQSFDTQIPAKKLTVQRHVIPK